MPELVGFQTMVILDPYGLDFQLLFKSGSSYCEYGINYFWCWLVFRVFKFQQTLFIFSDDSDNEEAQEIKMPGKKPSREQICRDNLDQGMKVIFDYIKENVDSANNSPSIIMSLYDDILKVS